MGLNRNLGNIPEIVKIHGSNVGINTSSDNGYKLEIGGTLKATGAITGDSFVKIGGTSSQLLTADGSVLTAGTGISISGGTISSTVTGGVTSFNTRTGAITLSSTDVTTALGYTPYNSTNPNGYISSYTETDPTVPSHVKSITTTDKSNWNTAFGWGNHASAGYVPSARTITINGTSYDLSANRSWTVTANAVETDTLATVTGRGASTSTLSYFTGGLSVDAGQLKFNENGVRSWNVQVSSGSLNFTSGDNLGDFTFNGGVNILTTRDSALVLRATDGGTSPWNYINYVNSAGTRKYYVGTDTSNVFNIYSDDGTGYVYSNTSFRAPLFYDSNNTAYYLDPASTSNLNSVNAITLTASGTSYASATGGFASSTYATGVRNPIWRFGNADGYGLSYFQGTAGQDNVDTIGFHFGTATNSGSQFKLKGNGALYASAAIFSPILYDLDNTGYYCDPASTSNLALLSLYGHDNQLKINTYSGGASGWFAQEAGVNKWETYHYQGRYRWYSYTTNQEEAFLDNAGGFLQVRTSMRAPIFYDSNNTGYYLDPDNRSNLSQTNISGIGLSGTLVLTGSGGTLDNSTGARLTESYGPLWNLTDSATWHHQVINGSMLCGFQAAGTNWGNGKIVANGDMRAPIFYDYNNTGYYVNPDGASRMNTINADVLRSYNDIYMDNDHGHTVVGLYSAYRFQGVFAMGDAYKLPVGGGSCGNHYGIAWSHPYAGGEAAHLTDHGMLIQVAGQTRVAISTDIWCIASITAYSDARVKDNIKVIDNPLERIKKVRGVTYTRTDLEDTSRKFAGVIAQEMREALPEVVSEDSNGQLSVAYGNSIGLLIECVKEQQTQIEQLKELVNQLINK